MKNYALPLLFVVSSYCFSFFLVSVIIGGSLVVVAAAEEPSTDSTSGSSIFDGVKKDDSDMIKEIIKSDTSAMVCNTYDIVS